jgi:hypothetical protein
MARGQRMRTLTAAYATAHTLLPLLHVS